MYEESFAKAFVDHLKVIRASHHENELKTWDNRKLKCKNKQIDEVSVLTLRAYDKRNNIIKGGSMRSVASSQITISSIKRTKHAYHCKYQNKRRILVGSSTSSSSHESKRNKSLMSFISLPNCGLRKRKTESSIANDDDSHAFVSALSNGPASFFI